MFTGQYKTRKKPNNSITYKGCKEKSESQNFPTSLPKLISGSNFVISTTTTINLFP